MQRIFKIFLGRLNELKGVRSVTAFANDCGIPQQTMANYCKGERVPGFNALYQICTANVVSSDWLLGFTDTRTGTAAPVTDAASASRIAELEGENARLRERVSALEYALSAIGGMGSMVRGRAPATDGAMGE